jgi:peptidoglycan/LPS O-acetylase OafA/YrhL
MNKLTSRHSNVLDYARFAAALAVFLDHFSSWPYTEKLIPRYYSRFGQIGVAIFFVLSGYVIAYVTSEREKDWTSYAVARVSRLYSVVPLALLVTFAADLLGSHLRPDYYKIPKVLAKPPSVEGYLSSFIFQNEWQVWNFHGIAPGTNNPFWSLSFEATYYGIIGLLLFAPKKYALPAACALLALSGWTFVAMFPIWLAGFGLYHLTRKIRIPKELGIGLLVLSVVGMAKVPHFLEKAPRAIPGLMALPFGRWQGNRNLIQDAVVVVLTTLFILGSSSLPERPTHKLSPHLDRVAKYLGNYTFPLYAFHYPLLCLFSAVSPYPHNTGRHGLYVALMIFTTITMLVPITDVSKDWLRRRLRRG